MSLNSSFTRIAGALPLPWREKPPVVPVVRLSGAIGMSLPLRPGLSMAGIASALDRAFSVPNARAVALLINSPGGSPVQSHLIHRRIRALAAEKSLPVYAFIEDVGASGGYMIACAADEVIADPSSIVGSIGVISPGFGFDGLMEKLGIERRVYSAGERKMTGDPFQPEREEDVARIRAIQRDVHDGFIALVRGRRGTRLNAADDILFSGEFWTGFRAVELGLVDRLGDIHSVMREVFGEEVRLKPITAPRGLGRRLLGQDRSRDGASIGNLGEGLIGAAVTHALWSRFGL